MPKHLKKILVAIVAVFFLLFGLLGIALPFLQGFLFIAIGIVLLSFISSTIRGWIEIHTRSHPKLHQLVGRIHAWVIRNIGPTD